MVVIHTRNGIKPVRDADDLSQRLLVVYVSLFYLKHHKDFKGAAKLILVFFMYLYERVVGGGKDQ